MKASVCVLQNVGIQLGTFVCLKQTQGTLGAATLQEATINLNNSISIHVTLKVLLHRKRNPWMELTFLCCGSNFYDLQQGEQHAFDNKGTQLNSGPKR